MQVEKLVVYSGSEIANKEYTDENFANVELRTTQQLEIEIELLNKKSAV